MYLGLMFVLLISTIFKETSAFAPQYRGRGIKTGRRNQAIDMKTSINTVPLNYRYYEQCRHQICASDDTYPEEGIKKALSDKTIVKNLFGNILNTNATDVSIFSRFNLFLGESSQLCSTEGPDTYEPRVMRNVNLKWKYIINLDEYKQQFTAELCRHTETFQTRRNDHGNFCRDFGFGCKQEYQDVYLLTYENGNIEFDKFSLPTTCSCSCS